MAVSQNKLGQVYSASLVDNQANQVLASISKLIIGAIFIEYQFKETGTGKYRAGIFVIHSDGSSAIESNDLVSLSILDTGITLSADISGDNIRFLASTSSSGNARTGNFLLRTLTKL